MKGISRPPRHLCVTAASGQYHEVECGGFSRKHKQQLTQSVFGNSSRPGGKQLKAAGRTRVFLPGQDFSGWTGEFCGPVFPSGPFPKQNEGASRQKCGLMMKARQMEPRWLCRTPISVPEITIETSLETWTFLDHPSPEVNRVLSGLQMRQPSGYSQLLTGSVGTQCILKTQDHTPAMQESSRTIVHAQPPASTTHAGLLLLLVLAGHGPTMLSPLETPQAHQWLWQETSMDIKRCADGGRRERQAGRSPAHGRSSPKPARGQPVCGLPGPAPRPQKQNPDSLWKLPALLASAAAMPR